MPRFLVKLAFLIAIVLITTNILACLLGRTKPLDPLLRGLTEACEGQPQTCWYGIVLGQTTIEEAASIVESKGYAVEIYTPSVPAEEYSGCRIGLYTRSAGHWLEGINIVDCDTVNLGDLMILLGQPDYLDVNCMGKPVAGYKYFLATLIDGRKVTPRSRVQLSIASQFGEFPAGEVPAYPMVFHWMGFRPLIDYYRLQPLVQVSFCGEG